MTDEPPVLGSWKRIRVLGCGGFGRVTLWHNTVSNADIAIKKLRENELPGIIKAKQKDRWCKEVDIMKKLSHLNVVTAMSIPEELNSLASSPLLAMEYCSLGDLRQILSKPENCCGLKEKTVIDILKDISAGLSYLHSCKIIHRDIKPDNIVLQKGEKRIVYKLIDLGYAKELDQNSVCESFVGTIQYLAPELFLGKPYTCSVDYWSFGLVTYEIITGYRPFLPGFTPANWMKQIQNKPRNIISVIENLNGEIIHSSSISKVNHVSRFFLQEIEKWLQLALDWNGQTRGKNSETKELIFFDSLTSILNKMSIQLFSLPTYELLSYEVKPDTQVSTLQSWISRDTGLEVDDQMLLIPGGKCVKSNGNVMQCFQDKDPEPGRVSMFLYSSSSLKIKTKTTLKPIYVKELLEDPKKELEYKHLKRSCSDSVFFLQSEASLYLYLLQAIRLKIENIKHRTNAVETLYEDVAEEWNQVETYAQFLIISHKTDLENYIQMRKAGELPTSGLVQKWIHRVEDVEKKLSELRTSSNKNHQKLAVTVAKERSHSLEGHELLQTVTKSALNDLVEDGQILYDRVQKIPRDVRAIAMSNTDMVKVLYRCLEQTSKLLKNVSIDHLFAQISETEDHLAKLVSPLTIWLKSTKIMKQIIESTQKERQKDIWSLIVRPKVLENKNNLKKDETENKKVPTESTKEPTKNASEAVKNTTEATKVSTEVTKNTTEDVKNVTEVTKKANQNINENGFSPFHIPKTVQNDLKSPVEEFLVMKPNFRVMEPVSIVPYKTDVNFNNYSAAPIPTTNASGPCVETNSIINDNNQLRYRTQDLTLSCHQMMKEIQSLNWDFLEDSA